MAFRNLLETMVFARIAIVIGTDASPQWRGLELDASTFEVIEGDGLQERWLLPGVALDRGHLDTIGKAIDLL